MWHLGTGFSAGLGSAGLMVGFSDLRGLFQSKWFYDLWKIPDPDWVWVIVALLTMSWQPAIQSQCWNMLSTWRAGLGDDFVCKGVSWDIWRGQSPPGHHSCCRAWSCSTQHFLPAGQTNSFLCLAGSDEHKPCQWHIGCVGTLPKGSQAPVLGSLHRGEPLLHFQRAAGKIWAARMCQGIRDPKEGQAFCYIILFKWHYMHIHTLEKLVLKWRQTSKVSLMYSSSHL